MQTYWPLAIFFYFSFWLALIDCVFFTFWICHISSEKKKGGRRFVCRLERELRRVKILSPSSKIDGGMANLAFKHYFGWPSSSILASLQCRDGARRVFTDQADIASTKREAPWGVRRVAWRVSCIRSACEADSLAYGRQRRMNWFALWCRHFQREQWGYYVVTASWAPYHKQHCAE